jgi:MFS family permease
MRGSLSRDDHGADAGGPSRPSGGPGADFWKFFAGQTVSNLGGSFTVFALPLLVYELTGSAVKLGIATAANFLPYLLFGLWIGVWADRLDRKRMMTVTNVLQAVVIASIPLAFVLGILTVWWVYAVGFLGSTLRIFFDAGQFAAIPSLVGRDDLVRANGRVQASYSAAQVLGPLLAGALLAVVPLVELFLVDALSFLVSALTLALVRRRFDEREADQRKATVREDVAEGLRYVLSHPVLRNVSIMMALVNLTFITTQAQLVLFAKQRLGAADPQVGALYAAGSLGVVALSLAAGPIRRRLPFSKAALGTQMVAGLLIVVFALNTSYPAALFLWATVVGLGVLFNINTTSLRQAIVPDTLMGRVVTVSRVLAWSAIPLGAYLGGIAVEYTGSVSVVYAAIGVLKCAIVGAFSFTALGRAERFLPQDG